MAIFEFSDNFDAQGWYTEQMLKGHSFDEDGYGWDEPAEYPSQGGEGRKCYSFVIKIMLYGLDK